MSIFSRISIGIKWPDRGWFWKAARKHAAPFCLDLFIIAGVAMWWTTFFQWFRFYHYIILAALMRWKKFDGFVMVRLLFAAIAFLFVDIVALSFFPLYCVSRAGFYISLATIPVCLYFLIKKMGPGTRPVVYSFLAAAALSIVIVGRANQPCTSEECDEVRADPDLEVLVDLTKLPAKRGLPRYALYRKDKKDLIISYRTPTPFVTGDIAKQRVYADRLDIETRGLKSISAITEQIIGMFYDEARDKMFFITANKFNHEHPKTLTVLGTDFQPEAVLDFPKGEDDDYTAYMLPIEGKVAIRAEAEGLYVFNPDTLDITNADPFNLKSFFKCRLFAEPGLVMISPTRFVMTGGGSPLMCAVTAAHAACSYDLAEKKFLKAYRSPPNGLYDVDYIPDRGEVMATSIWGSSIRVISADELKHLRTLRVGGCLRPVAYDRKKRVGYTIESFTGNLLTFDVESGKVLRKKYVGASARKIYVFDDLGPVILSGCGVLRLRR